MLEQIGRRRQPTKPIVSRNIKLKGKVVIHNDFITNKFEETVSRKKSRGRPRKKYPEDVQKSINFSLFYKTKKVTGDEDE